MTWIYLGLMIVGVIAGVFIGTLIFNILSSKWINFRFPDYARRLTEEDVNFIRNAQESLSLFASGKAYHSPWNWVRYVLSGLLLIILPFGLGYFVCKFGSFLYLQMPKVQQLTESSLYLEINVGVSAVIGIFGAISFSGWFVYFLTNSIPNFTEWMVLTLGTKGESDQNILKRRVHEIEHSFRIGRLDSRQTFDPSNFLKSIARRHGRYCAIIAFVISALALAFLPLDLRSKTIFYDQGLEFTNYWTGKVTQVDYSNLSAVESQCSYSNKNNREIFLHFIDGDRQLARCRVARKNLEKFLKIDFRLREQNVLFRPHFVHHSKQAPRLAFLPKCVESLEKIYSKSDAPWVKQILHVNDLMAQ